MSDKDFEAYVAGLPPPGKKAKGTKIETRIQRLIVTALQAKGLWVVRIAGQGTVQMTARGAGVLKKSEMAGFPDLLVLGPEGLTAWLEVKAPKGRLSPIQKSRHARLQALGHCVAVVRSADEALKVLEANGWFLEPTAFSPLSTDA
jgi:hypothetical protein